MCEPCLPGVSEESKPGRREEEQLKDEPKTVFQSQGHASVLFWRRFRATAFVHGSGSVLNGFKLQASGSLPSLRGPLT